MDRRDKSHGRKSDRRDNKDLHPAKPNKRKDGEVLLPPPPPKTSGKATVYPREPTPPSVVPTPAPSRGRASTSRSSPAPTSEIIPVDFEAPLAVPEDHLDNVLPYIEGKEPQLADWISVMLPPAAEHALVPAPSVQAPPTEEKKRPAETSGDKVSGTIVKKPRSPHHDFPDDALPYGMSYYSTEARTLRVTIAKHKKLYQSAADILSILGHPWSGETSGVPSLALPAESHADRHRKKVVINDLVEIQTALRPRPLEKEHVIGMIECDLMAWDDLFKGTPPADLQSLMAHLKSLVTRLEGGEILESLGKATPMVSQARPLLQQLEAACKEIADGIARLRANRPHLEKRVADLVELRAKQQAAAEKYDKLAADARRREGEVTGVLETYSINIKAHDDAVATSSKEADLLAKSRDEMAKFLATRDEEETNRSSPAAGLSEAQIILSYQPEN